MEIHKRRTKIQDIPVMDVYRADSNGKHPLILFLHPFGCDKETHLNEAIHLTQRGFRVLLPDAYLHGERALSHLDAIGPFKKAEQMDKIYLQSSATVQKLIEHETSNDDVSVGLIGVSMGGCAALHHVICQRHPRVKAAAVLIASPYWTNHLKHSAAVLPEFGGYLDEELLERVHTIEPAQFLAKMKDFPLLFQNGASDEFVPIDDARRSVKILKAAYQCQNLVELIEYERIGHQCIPEMFIKAAEWLEMHL